MPLVSLVGPGSRLYAPPQEEQGTNFKFSPNHYLMYDTGSGGGTDLEKQELMADYASEENLVGFFLKDRWKNLEGNTQGDYSAGDARIDDYLDALPPGKVFVLGVKDQLFGSSIPSDGHGLLPTYLDGIDGGPALWPGGDPWSGTLIIQAKLYELATMDRYIALFTHYIERYQDDDRFEMMITGETAMGVEGQGYTSAKLLTQYLRFASEIRAVATRTPVGISTNYLGNLSIIQTLMEACGNNLIDTGGPDTMPRSERQFDDAEIYLGNDGSDPGDLRGIVPRIAQVDGTEIGGYLGNFTPSQLWNDSSYGHANMGYTRWFWYHNLPGRMPDSTSATQWGDGASQGILWWIRNHSIADAAYPYGELVDDGSTPSGPTTITHVSTGTVVEANNGSVTPTFGATAQAGDVALVFACIRAASAGRTLACDTYTTLRSFGVSSQQPMYLLAKVMSGGETESSAVVPAGGAAGDVVQAVAMLMRGMSNTLGTLVHAGANKTTTGANSSTPIVTVEVPITEANCMTMAFVSYQEDCSALGNFNPNAAGNWTRPVFTSTTTGNDQTIAVYENLQTATTTVNAGTISITGQTTGVVARTMLVALRAA